MTQAVFEKTIMDYVDMGGGFLSLTPLVGDLFLDRHLLQRLTFLESVPAVSSLGVTTNGAMAHRFDDHELDYILGRFKYISISIYGVDQIEYETMTRKKTYTQMVDGLRRILAYAQVPVSLEFRLLNKKTETQLKDWITNEVCPSSDSQFYINSVISDYANWGIYDQETRPLSGEAKWMPSERQERRPQCLIPMFACLVYSNGNVSFCPCDNFDDDQELRIGSVLETSLGDLYNSPSVRALWNWNKYGTPEFCKTCSFHIGLDRLAADPDILYNPHKIVGAG